MSFADSVTDVAFKEITIHQLYDMAKHTFAQPTAKISDIHERNMMGVPGLGAMFPKAFGPAKFEAFIIERPTRIDTVSYSHVKGSYEVTSIMGLPDQHEMLIRRPLTFNGVVDLLKLENG